ncbi:uncharacterized protein LOC115798476 [Archocentrus centrarchus]|uniref:uncharacterized protein LOC115798476 n=1 Tax=Archocentrus centrarchus TaxID=63155 RepID=UPI0011EA524F|nr:uncharacterized protein LOC115798476 [Archocentrus centrarchus]
MKYRQAVDSGCRSGHGRVVLLVFELCEQIWGGSPATSTLEVGLETADLEDSGADSTASSSRSSTPLPAMSYAPMDDPGASPVQLDVSQARRAELEAKLSNHRKDRLKRKMHSDPAVLEELQLKRRMIDLLEESERRNSERLDKISENICNITSTIRDGFTLLGQLMTQQQQPYSFAQGHMGGYAQGPFAHTQQHFFSGPASAQAHRAPTQHNCQHNSQHNSQHGDFLDL